MNLRPQAASAPSELKPSALPPKFYTSDRRRGATNGGGRGLRLHLSVSSRLSRSETAVLAVSPDDLLKGPEVRSGDLLQPINLERGQEFTFTIKRGVGTEDCVSVNYDDFVSHVEVGDTLLVDGGMMSLVVKSKTEDSVKCEVVDGGELKSRRHLNVRGKSATLPSITEKDWDDIKFGVDNKVDYYAVSFVKDADVVHELKGYLGSNCLNKGFTLF